MLLAAELLAAEQRRDAAAADCLPMQFEMRLQTVVGEFYQHCN